jgi:CTD small phosphatase-like protein 2
MYRHHCVQTPEGIYIKDLRVISNRNLKDIAIIDNAAYSFGFQLDNGIPIIPFYNDPDDDELLHLINYMDVLATTEDFRIENRNAFHLSEFDSEEIQNYLDAICQAAASDDIILEKDEEKRG